MVGGTLLPCFWQIFHGSSPWAALAAFVQADSRNYRLLPFRILVNPGLSAAEVIMAEAIPDLAGAGRYRLASVPAWVLLYNKRGRMSSPFAGWNRAGLSPYTIPGMGAGRPICPPSPRPSGAPVPFSLGTILRGPACRVNPLPVGRPPPGAANYVASTWCPRYTPRRRVSTLPVQIRPNLNPYPREYRARVYARVCAGARIYVTPQRRKNGSKLSDKLLIWRHILGW